MKAYAEKYGQVKGKMKGPKKDMKSLDPKALKSGLVMEEPEENEASDMDSRDSTDDAPTAGLSKSSSSSSKIQSMPTNELKHQSGMHEASGFVSKGSM